MKIQYQLASSGLLAVLLGGCSTGTLGDEAAKPCSPACQNGQHCNTTDGICDCDNPCAAEGSFCDAFGSGQIGTCAHDGVTGCFSVASLADCPTAGETCAVGAGACAAPGAALQIATTSLPDARIDVTYAALLAASGGTTPYTWSIASGSLPSGLQLDASGGIVNGTPAAAGTSDFTVQVTDAASATQSKALSIAVSSSGAFVITSPLAPDKTSLQLGDTVTASVTYTNQTSSAVVVQALVIAGRRPGATHDGGINDDLSPTTSGTVPPAGTLSLTASRTWTVSDLVGTWEIYSTWEDDADVWHDGPSVYLTVPKPQRCGDSHSRAQCFFNSTRNSVTSFDAARTRPGCKSAHVCSGTKNPVAACFLELGSAGSISNRKRTSSPSRRSIAARGEY